MIWALSGSDINQASGLPRQCLLTGTVCLSLLTESGREDVGVCVPTWEELGAPVGLCSGRGRGLASGAIQTQCEAPVAGVGVSRQGVQDMRPEGSVMGTTGVLGLERADTAPGDRPRWIDGGGFWNGGGLEMPPASPQQHRPVSSGPPSPPKHATALSRSRFNRLCCPCPCSLLLDLVPTPPPPNQGPKPQDTEQIVGPDSSPPAALSGPPHARVRVGAAHHAGPVLGRYPSQQGAGLRD